MSAADFSWVAPGWTSSAMMCTGSGGLSPEARTTAGGVLDGSDATPKLAQPRASHGKPARQQPQASRRVGLSRWHASGSLGKIERRAQAMTESPLAQL